MALLVATVSVALGRAWASDLTTAAPSPRAGSPVAAVPQTDLGRLDAPAIGAEAGLSLDANGIPSLPQAMPMVEAFGQAPLQAGALGAVNGPAQLSAAGAAMAGRNASFQSVEAASRSQLQSGADASGLSGYAAGRRFFDRDAERGELRDAVASTRFSPGAMDLRPSGLTKAAPRRGASLLPRVAALASAAAATAASAVPASASTFENVIGLNTQPEWLGMLQFGLVVVLFVGGLVGLGAGFAAIPDKLRRRSIEAYAKKSDAEILGLMGDASATVRGRAIAALEKKGSAAAHASKLIDVAERDSDVDVRLQAISTLGDIRAADASDMLLRTIRYEQTQDSELLFGALGAVVRIGEPAAMTQLAKLTQVELAGYAHTAGEAAAPLAGRVVSLYMDRPAETGFAALFSAVAAAGGGGAILLAKTKQLIDAGDTEVRYTAMVPMMAGKSVILVPQSRTRTATGAEMLERAQEKLAAPAGA